MTNTIRILIVSCLKNGVLASTCLTSKDKEMAVIYKVAKSHIAKKDGSLCYYPVLVKNGVVSTMKIAKAIAESSALTVGDVYSVLLNLGGVMHSALMNSKSVQIENFGSFTLKSKSKSKPVMEDVDADCIERLKILFTPAKHKVNGSRVAEMLEGASFKNIEDLSAGLTYTPNEGDKYLEPGALVNGEDKGSDDGKGGDDDDHSGEKPAGGEDKGDDPSGGDGGDGGHEPVDDPGGSIDE
jgi:predicted histone-like DNA-binding protein